jgi:hypothetical protein
MAKFLICAGHQFNPQQYANQANQSIFCNRVLVTFVTYLLRPILLGSITKRNYQVRYLLVLH